MLVDQPASQVQPHAPPALGVPWPPQFTVPHPSPCVRQQRRPGLSCPMYSDDAGITMQALRCRRYMVKLTAHPLGFQTAL